MLLNCKNGHGPMTPNFSMSGDHIKATCFICGCYIKFVAYKDLSEEDLKNLKAWQEDQIGLACDHEHKDQHIIKEEMEDSLEAFKYCPWCGILLEGGD